MGDNMIMENLETRKATINDIEKVLKYIDTPEFRRDNCFMFRRSVEDIIRGKTQQQILLIPFYRRCFLVSILIFLITER